ncbi:MAG: Fe-S cluster assembly protein SufB [Candidatus Pacebacteria bacterium]|nr:Fe-S cluster assembly protein SufB [Candidatus Paceibacterota bacterium]
MSNTSQLNVMPTRTLYDDANLDVSKYRAKPGVTEEVVREISKQKNEPEWMLEKRLQSLELFKQTPVPTWGPDLSKLNLDEIVYFIRPDTKEATSWDDVPDDIKKTFDRLGIPEAEKKVLAGVGAQYDSDVVYHNIQEDLKKKGVVFLNMDTAVQEYPELVQKYFMTQCVPINDHKFVMLHGAVWSGGTFIYAPKNVKVDLPLQAYFRMNAERGGQFEHTLIIADEGSEIQYIEGCSAPRYASSSLHAGCVEIFVHKGARARYYSIENWSKNTYNLNTKRALVDEDGVIEWINGNMGSGVTMLYPSSILRGRGARSDSLGVAFAGPGQNQDTGAKAIHVAPDTKSTIKAKSISVGGGITTYRGMVKVTKKAEESAVSVECDALLIDNESVSNTHPYMKIDNSKVDVVHEARVGRIGDDEIFYLQSRGLSAEQAMRLVVSGFVEPIVKALPLEYALELNRLIELEMEGAVG